MYCYHSVNINIFGLTITLSKNSKLPYSDKLRDHETTRLMSKDFGVDLVPPFAVLSVGKLDRFLSDQRQAELKQ
jgi:hypothetical protein